MSNRRWTEGESKLAFHLYCQLPFGRLHQRNDEIIELAALLDRTPSAVAMKLVNFASLDPAIISSGRKGLDGASKLDHEVWDNFHADWEGLAVECVALRNNLIAIREPSHVEVAENETAYFVGETRAAIVEQRIKQHFFRRAVLSSYRGRCCMTGVTESRLLLASHIVPWSQDKANRLNPANGLCLSALHDRAFDQGLISVSAEYRVLLSASVATADEPLMQHAFKALEARPIELPERFLPDPAFLAWHREHVFNGAA